jgi:hypothetical protein
MRSPCPIAPHARCAGRLPGAAAPSHSPRRISVISCLVMRRHAATCSHMQPHAAVRPCSCAATQPGGQAAMQLRGHACAPGTRRPCAASLASIRHVATAAAVGSARYADGATARETRVGVPSGCSASSAAASRPAKWSVATASPYLVRRVAVGRRHLQRGPGAGGSHRPHGCHHGAGGYGRLGAGRRCRRTRGPSRGRAGAAGARGGHPGATTAVARMRDALT